jgi:predicted dehydrogenase
MDHFSERVLNDKAPLTPGEEGLQDLKIMKTACESTQSGKAVKIG